MTYLVSLLTSSQKPSLFKRATSLVSFRTLIRSLDPVDFIKGGAQCVGPFVYIRMDDSNRNDRTQPIPHAFDDMLLSMMGNHLRLGLLFAFLMIS